MKEKCAFLVVLYLLGSSQTASEGLEDIFPGSSILSGFILNNFEPHSRVRGSNLFSNNQLARTLFIETAINNEADEVFPTKTTPVVKSAPIIISNQRLFTRVSLNGRKEVNFFVDNGWRQTTIDSRLLNDCGFEPAGEISYKVMHKSSQEGETGRVAKLKVGDFEIVEPEVMSANIFSIMTRNFQRKVHGVLGYEIMKPYLTTFDFRKKRIHFAPNTVEAVEEMKKHVDVISLPFGANLLSQVSNHLFTVKIQINGMQVNAFFDIGFPGSVVTNLDHRELGLHVNFNGRKTEFAVAGHWGHVYKASARELMVGDHAERKVEVLYLQSKEDRRFTLVGVDFIRKFNMTLDYKNGTLYLVPHSSRCADKYLRLESCVR